MIVILLDIMNILASPWYKMRIQISHHPPVAICSSNSDASDYCTVYIFTNFEGQSLYKSKFSSRKLL